MAVPVYIRMRPDVNLLRPEAVSVMIPTTVTGTDGNKRVRDMDTPLVGRYSVQSLFGNAPTILDAGGQRLVSTDQIIGPPDPAFQVGRIVTRTATGSKYRIQDIRHLTDAIRALVLNMAPP